MDQAASADEHAGLSAAVKQQIRDGLTALAQAPGFRSRKTQRLMIAEVAKTLAGEYGGEERVLCVEGPTGTGKSLAYLLPAIPVAQARDKALVIATATVALQEQLVTKDLPELRAQTGMEFTFALAKGRRRYVCDRNLERLAGADRNQKSLDFGADAAATGDWPFRPQADDIQLVERMWAAREDGSFSGDLDEWPEPISDDLRQALTTDRNGCAGKSCPFYSRCAFFAARRQLFERDVIVANHALVMADLLLGGGALLPVPEDSIYIFDEGHHLPAVAIDQGGAQTRLRDPQSWLKDLNELPQKAARAAPTNAQITQAMDDIAPALAADIPRLINSLDEVHRFLAAEHPAQQSQADQGRRRGRGGRNSWASADANWRFPGGLVPDALRELFGQARDAGEAVCETALKLDNRLRQAADKQPDDRALGAAQASAHWLAARLSQMQGALGQMAAVAPPVPATKTPQPPVARWVESIDEGRDFACHASPTSAAQLLREILWTRCDGAIVTSGTLAALGRFERFFEQTGLGPDYGTQALRLASPFDYAHNARLDIPAMWSSPKRSHDHTDEIIDRIDDGLIDLRAGTLMLFSSYRQMQAVAEGVIPEVGDRILMQGRAPRHELLAAHRRRIDAGEGSILFGVASFAEGIDLPGRYCTHVIIAKIPFAVPDSPIHATFAEWLEAQGRNPFMEIAVPEAGFRLVQAAGRLLRTEADTGRVTMLDRRLADMPYGRVMLAALPPFQHNIEPARRRS